MHRYEQARFTPTHIREEFEAEVHEEVELWFSDVKTDGVDVEGPKDKRKTMRRAFYGIIGDISKVGYHDGETCNRCRSMMIHYKKLFAHLGGCRSRTMEAMFADGGPEA